MNIRDLVIDINKGHEGALSYKKLDGLIIKVLWLHLGVFSLLAFLNAGLKVADMYPSPLGWRTVSTTEGVVAVLVAFLATLIPILAREYIRNHYYWRILITTSLTAYSYLFVFISGGAVEMHFHFFIAAALLVVYLDWRLGWWLLVLTLLHHFVLGLIKSGWTDFYGTSNLAILAYAVPVFAAVMFTTMISRMGRDAFMTLEQVHQKLEERTNELEKLKNSLEHIVEHKTRELAAKVAELENMNKLMVGRELKMVELKKEITKLHEDQHGAAA